MPKLLLAGLLAVPMLAAAQAPAGRPHLYVGIGASALTYAAPARSTTFFTGNLPGPALTVGAQLNRRWALELGASYAWPGKIHAVSSNSSSEVQLRVLSVPLLARYDWLPAARRWHLESVAGLTVRDAREYYTYNTVLYNGQPLHSQSVDYATGVALSLGPAVRYTLARHLDLTAEPLLSAELTHYDFNGVGTPEAMPIYSLSDRLFWNVRARVRYHFGR